MGKSIRTALLLCSVLFAGAPAGAQSYYTPEQLDQMLQPLALYPDPLLAQILPACAYPQELDAAQQYINANGPNDIDGQGFDAPVAAVAHYPDVLSMLDGNLAWASALGQAYVAQARDVMASVQRLRMQASQNGALASGPQENVDVQGDYVTITPTNPNVIYVPQYNPAYVYGAYPYGYPRPGISFSVGFGTGSWLSLGIDWMGGYCVPYPPGVYWGYGPWEQWNRGGNYVNVSYFHNNFNPQNRGYQINRQHFNQYRLSPARMNQARINDYRGKVPSANPGLPQWHGSNGATLVRPQPQQPVPGSVVHGPGGIFNVQPQSQTRTYEQRGSSSLQSQPNVTGIQRYAPPQQRQAPSAPRYSPPPQRSAPSRSAPSRHEEHR